MTCTNLILSKVSRSQRWKYYSAAMHACTDRLKMATLKLGNCTNNIPKPLHTSMVSRWFYYNT